MVTETAARVEELNKAVLAAARQFRVDEKTVRDTFPRASTNFLHCLAKVGKDALITWDNLVPALETESQKRRNRTSRGPSVLYSGKMVQDVARKLKQHQSEEIRVATLSQETDPEYSSGDERSKPTFRAQSGNSPTYDQSRTVDTLRAKRAIPEENDKHTQKKLKAAVRNRPPPDVKTTKNVTSRSSIFSPNTDNIGKPLTPIASEHTHQLGGGYSDRDLSDRIECSTSPSLEPLREMNEAHSSEHDMPDEIRISSESPPLPIDSFYASFFTLNAESLDRVRPGKWFNDEVVDGLFQLFEALVGSTRLRVISSLTNSFGRFFQPDFGSATVMKPLKLDTRIKGSAIEHWVLLVIKPRGKWAMVLDSLPCAEETRRLADVELRTLYDKCFGETLQTDSIQYTSPMIQNNDYDCGLITVLYGWFLAAGMSLPCGQPDSCAWRKAIHVILQPLSESEKTRIASADDLLFRSNAADLVDDACTFQPKVPQISLDKPEQFHGFIETLLSEVDKAAGQELARCVHSWKQDANLAPTVQCVTGLMGKEDNNQVDEKRRRRKREATVRFQRLQKHIEEKDERAPKLYKTQALARRLLDNMFSKESIPTMRQTKRYTESG